MFVWPEFPADRPKFLRDKLVVAWVAYQCSTASRDKAECHLAVRHLEMRFSFSSQSVAEACLKRLTKMKTRKEGAWLEISTAAAGIKGNHYRLGTRAAADYDQWVDVGTALFEPGGSLERYMTRPVFRGRGLGPEGCVALACVERCGPVAQKDVIGLLATFVAESTVRKRLRILETEGLVKRKGDRLYTTRRLANEVSEYERTYDLVDAHIDHHQRLLKESLAYQVELTGGPQLTTLKATLRKMRCFYCTKLPSPTGETVEHFPPRNWGGSDDVSLLLPCCHGCNKSHGPLIRSYTETVIDRSVGRLVMDISPSEMRDWLTEAMLLAASNYAAALNSRDVAAAVAIAQSPIVSLWAAMRQGDNGLLIVNAVTGEAASSTDSDGSPDITGALELLSGLADLHTPRQTVKKKRA